MSDKIHPLDAIRALEESSALKACIEALEREVAELRASRDGYVKQAVAREAEAERKIAELEAINAILMGADEDKPRYTTRRMKQEVARQTEVVRQELIVAEAREARLSEALRPFADMADYLDSETEGFADTDEFDLLYEDHLFHHFKVADFRDARAALSGSGSGWRAMAIEAAIQEYGLTDNLAGAAENAGRHSAVRGLMARLGLYTEFVAALNGETLPATPLSTGGE